MIRLLDGSVPAYTVNSEAIYTMFKKDFCPIDDLAVLAGFTTGSDDDDGAWYGPVAQNYNIEVVTAMESFSVEGFF